MAEIDIHKEFVALVKEIIVPVFQVHGFTKSGNNFYRENNEVGQFFNIQQSRWNVACEKSFVFNVGLIDKEVHTYVYNREIPKCPKEHDCDIRLRLGHLMSTGDNWYDMNERTDISKLRAQVTYDIETFAIPFYDRYSDPVRWVEFFEWHQEPLVSPIGKFLIMERYGKRDMAESFLKELYMEALTPKPSVRETHTPSGEVIRTESNSAVNKEWIGRLLDLANRSNITLNTPPDYDTSLNAGLL